MSRDRLTWRKLVPGVLALAAIVGGALAVLLFARVGALHGDTYRLYALANEARGVIKGTDVWLAGQKVGLVSKITFRSATVDTSARLLLELEVLEDYQPFIRADSYAHIRSGGSLIGAPIVWITTGSHETPELADGDSLASVKQVDTEGIASELAIASRQFPFIVQNVRHLNAQLASMQQLIGGVTGESRGEELRVLSTRAKSLTRRARTGAGTVSLVMRDTTLLRRATRAIARRDSVMLLLRSKRSSLGRFRRDSTLLRNLSAVRDEVAIVRARLAEPRGTAGRLMRDSALVHELGRVQRELGRTIEDLKRDPARYIAF
jgi:phospholipid/cholesterol/gamma-HCH transport system substrate-binding protein